MPTVASSTNIESKRNLWEELQQKKLNEDTTENINSQNEKVIADSSYGSYESDAYYGGMSTEAAAQREKDALALAKARNFEGRETENPKNRMGATLLGEQNRLNINYNFYSLRRPDEIESEKMAAAV